MRIWLGAVGGGGGAVVGGTVVGGTVVGGTVVVGVVSTVAGGTVASVDGIACVVAGGVPKVVCAVDSGDVAPGSEWETQLLKSRPVIIAAISRKARHFIGNFMIIPSFLAYFTIIGVERGKVNRIGRIRHHSSGSCTVLCNSFLFFRWG